MGGSSPSGDVSSGLVRVGGYGPQTPPASLPSREEKAELLLDSQAEVQGLEAEVRRLRQEVRAEDAPAIAAFPNPPPQPPVLLPSAARSFPPLIPLARAGCSQPRIVWPRPRRCQDRPGGPSCTARRQRRCGSGPAACPACRRSCDAAGSGCRLQRPARASWRCGAAGLRRLGVGHEEERI